MSQVISSPQNCCLPCPEPATVNIPGPQGDTGAAGTNGTNGINAYTLVTAPFTMPAEAATVSVDVAESRWAVVGQKVFVGKLASAAKGTFEVSQVPDETHVVLTNVENTAAGEYTENSVAGTVFPAGSSVGPSGLQGPAGAAGAGGAPVDATYITQVASGGLSAEQALSGLATGLMRSTTGTGVVNTVAETTAAAGQAPNDGALTNGDACFATATGIQTKTAANARTALGLGTMATQNANNVAITGGSITGVTLPVPTGVPGEWGVLQNQQATTVNGGNFVQGSWVTVPLNTEVTDTGGNVVLAANVGTFAAGTYRFRWAVPGYGVDAFQTRLVEGVATVRAYGSNANAGSADTSGDTSFGWCRLALAGGAQVRLEARCTLTNANGFGVANSFGGTEVYGTLEFEKEG